DARLASSAFRHYRVAAAGDGAVAAGRRDVTRDAQPVLRTVAAKQSPLLALVVVGEDADAVLAAVRAALDRERAALLHAVLRRRVGELCLRQGHGRRQAAEQSDTESRDGVFKHVHYRSSNG